MPLAPMQEAMFITLPGYDGYEEDDRKKVDHLNTILADGGKVIHATGAGDFVFVVVEHR